MDLVKYLEEFCQRFHNRFQVLDGLVERCKIDGIQLLYRLLQSGLTGFHKGVDAIDHAAKVYRSQFFRYLLQIGQHFLHLRLMQQLYEMISALETEEANLYDLLESAEKTLSELETEDEV